MRETAVVCWFEVQKCGFFSKRGDETPAFGDLQEVMEDLSRWARGKLLGETATFAAVDESSLLPVYLMDVRDDGAGNWLLTLWNQTPSTNGAIATVMANSAVGDAEVVMTETREGSIPGYATYFYVVPEAEAIAGVRFQHPAFGHAGMKKYIRSFMKSCSSHAVYAEAAAPGADVEVLGYAERPGEGAGRYRPRFDSEVKRLPGEVDRIRRNANRIAKVVRKEVLEAHVRPERQFWQSVLGRFGLADRRGDLQSTRVQYTVDVSMVPRDVDTVIETWEALADDEWGDIGFIFQGESTKTHWLSQSVARDKFDVEVDRSSDEVVAPQSLLRELTIKRAALLRMIRA